MQVVKDKRQDPGYDPIKYILKLDKINITEGLSMLSAYMIIDQENTISKVRSLFEKGVPHSIHETLILALKQCQACTFTLEQIKNLILGCRL